MRIRRASRLSVYNSLFLGWGRGVRLESSFTHHAAVSDELAVKNNILGGIYGKRYGDASVMTDTEVESWFLAAARKNRMLGSDAEAMIADPFNLAAPKFQPLAGSPVLNASYWVITSSRGISMDEGSLALRSYPNPFSGSATVEVNVARNTKGSLVVYNLSGAVMSVLHSGDMPGGSHNFTFEAGNLPKGIYLVRLITGQENKTLKILAQ